MIIVLEFSRLHGRHSMSFKPVPYGSVFAARGADLAHNLVL